MPEYLTLGVYVEEVSYQAPTIEGVGTSTAGFAGVTLTGPTNSTPELLTSFGDFQNIYGGYDNLALSSNSSDPANTNYLALGVNNLICALSPQRIILGGGVLRRETLYSLIRAKVAELLAGYVAPPEIVPPMLGARAGVLGAIALADSAAP